MYRRHKAVSELVGGDGIEALAELLVMLELRASRHSWRLGCHVYGVAYITLLDPGFLQHPTARKL